jgi:putative transposase
MKTYAYKLYTTRKTRYLDALLTVACDIYNWVLLTKREAYSRDKTYISLYDMYGLVRDRRNEPNSAWQMINATATRQIVDRIYIGYDHFFDDLRRGVKTSPPKFKKTPKYRSITFRQDTGYKLLDDNTLYISGQSYHGRGGKTFRFHKHRDWEGKIKTLTVKKNSLGEWFIYITTDFQEASKQETRSGKSVGFDFGLKNFLTGSDGTAIQSPLFFKQSSKKIRRLNQQLDSKVKGSGNSKRALRALAKAHDDIANQRKDFHWQLAYQLVQTYETICLETLNLKGMQALCSRKIGDLGLYSFVQKLVYMASKYGSKVIFIDRFYPSSKTCSCCQHINETLDLKDREWDCSNCGTHHDRDANAAINIHTQGMSLLKSKNGVGISTLVGVEVRPAKPTRKRGKQALSVDGTISNG